MYIINKYCQRQTEIKTSEILRTRAFIKEIKNAPSALLSYISTREFLRTRKKCREARAVGQCLSALLEQSGTVIKFDNQDQNKLLANQTSSYSSRDMLS